MNIGSCSTDVDNGKITDIVIKKLSCFHNRSGSRDDISGYHITDMLHTCSLHDMLLKYIVNYFARWLNIKEIQFRINILCDVKRNSGF